ncbi:hypothetical protein ACEPAI_2918 [Sanghuangporus weigelae]
MDYYHGDFISTLHAPIPRRASVSEHSLSLPEGGQNEASLSNVYDYDLGGLNGSFIPPTFVASYDIPAGLHGLNNPTFTSEAHDIYGGMDLPSVHDGYDRLYSESSQTDFEPLGFSSETASGFNNHYSPNNSDFSAFVPSPTSSASSSTSLSLELMTPIDPSGLTPPPVFSSPEVETHYTLPLLPSLDSVKEETFTPVMEETGYQLYDDSHIPFAQPPASSASTSTSLTQEIMTPADPTDFAGPHFSQSFEAGTQFALPLLPSLDAIKQETVASVTEDTAEFPRSTPPALDASPGPVKDEALISHGTSPESAAGVPSASSSSASPVNTPQALSIDEDRIPCIYDDCPVTFVDVRGRNRHIRHIHLGERIFCPGMCREEGFSRSDSLNRHLHSLGERTKCRREARKWGWRPKTKGTINKLWDFIPDLAD